MFPSLEFIELQRQSASSGCQTKQSIHGTCRFAVLQVQFAHPITIECYGWWFHIAEQPPNFISQSRPWASSYGSRNGWPTDKLNCSIDVYQWTFKNYMQTNICAVNNSRCNHLLVHHVNFLMQDNLALQPVRDSPQVKSCRCPHLSSSWCLPPNISTYISAYIGVHLSMPLYLPISPPIYLA